MHIKVVVGVYILLHHRRAQSAGAVEYTDFFSAEVEDPHPMSLLDMTLKNLMVTFQ